MKGQIFIITSILVLVALLATRISTKTTFVKQDELFYESFSNVKVELVRTVDLALLNGDDVANKLQDFKDFSVEVFKKKGYNLGIDYIVSSGSTTIVYLNVSLSSSNSYLLDSLIINRTVYT